MKADDIQRAKQILGDRAADIIVSGLSIQSWDTKNLKGCCPFHNEKTASFTWYKDHNYFKCFGCGITLDILDYYQQSGMDFQSSMQELFKQAGLPYEPTKDIKHVGKDNRPYQYPEAEQEPSTVEKYLSQRHISKKTIDYAEVKQDKQGNIAFEYRNQSGTLLMVKYRPSHKIKKGEIKSWCQKDKDTTPILYGMEKIDPTKPLLICEGEIDRLAAIEAGFFNSVSVPFGAGNYTWIEHNWEWLEQFEKIIIWSDNDDAGEKMRKETIPRLGEYRCYTIQSKHKDINECLYREGKEKTLEAIQTAKEVPIQNVVDMADVPEFDINKAEKIRSGLSGLDRWIHGFVLGTVNIVTGINGSGKSTFIDQACICEPLEQGYKTFIFSGELTKPQLRNWIESPMAGPKHIERVDYGQDIEPGYRVPIKIKELMRNWYREHIYFYDNDLDYTAKTILKKMEEMARRYGVKNFIIDNLMMMDLECNEYEKYSKQKVFVLDLIKFARKYLCVVHLVAHPRKTETVQRLTKLDVSGSGDIANLVHYIIAIHRVMPSEKADKLNKKGDVIEEGCKYDCIVDLFKNRPLGHQDKSVGVYFDYPSKRFYGDSDRYDKEYSWVEKTSQMKGFTEVEGVKAPWD